MPTTSSSLTVAANRIVNINQANFNLDGSNAATNVITVNDGAVLTISTGDYDTDSATNAFDGTVNLDERHDRHQHRRRRVRHGRRAELPRLRQQSEPLDRRGPRHRQRRRRARRRREHHAARQPTQFGAQVDFNSDADVNVADGATVHFLATVNFNTVNGGNNAEFTGGGELIFSAGVNFNEATHLNMVGGTVDLDGADSIGDTINIDAPLTINAALMRSFGKNNGGGGMNILDVNNSVNTGALTVNLDDADAEWTLNVAGRDEPGERQHRRDAAGRQRRERQRHGERHRRRADRRPESTSVRRHREHQHGGSAAAARRRQRHDDPNTIAGGTINGVGLLGADAGKALHGFGTINAASTSTASANLRPTMAR